MRQLLGGNHLAKKLENGSSLKKAAGGLLGHWCLRTVMMMEVIEVAEDDSF